LAIEFITVANEFAALQISLAIEFVALAQEFELSLRNQLL